MTPQVKAILKKPKYEKFCRGDGFSKPFSFLLRWFLTRCSSSQEGKRKRGEQEEEWLQWKRRKEGEEHH